MKKMYAACFFLFNVMAICSCVSSLYPISENENDFLIREELIGRWTDKDMNTQVIIQKAAHRRYSVVVIDKKDKSNSSISDSSYFSGFLIHFDSGYFFDCTPDTDHPQFDCLGEETKSGLLPLHFIYKVYRLEKDQLVLAGMNIDSMQKFLDNDKFSVKHEKLNKDHILITADAGGLQKKILTNKEAALLFSEPAILNREK